MKKNNLLYSLMSKDKIKTLSELARKSGLSNCDVGAVANLKIGAYYRSGKQSRITTLLCEYFGCLPEDIYPKEVIFKGMDEKMIEGAVSFFEIEQKTRQEELDVGSPVIIFQKGVILYSEPAIF